MKVEYAIMINETNNDAKNVDWTGHYRKWHELKNGPRESGNSYHSTNRGCSEAEYNNA